jgi:hypothetical protein
MIKCDIPCAAIWRCAVRHAERPAPFAAASWRSLIFVSSPSAWSAGRALVSSPTPHNKLNCCKMNRSVKTGQVTDAGGFAAGSGLRIAPSHRRYQDLSADGIAGLPGTSCPGRNRGDFIKEQGGKGESRRFGCRISRPAANVPRASGQNHSFDLTTTTTPKSIPALR